MPQLRRLVPHRPELDIPARQRVVRLVRRPDGRPTPDIFAPLDATLRPPREGEFLVRNVLFSIDPALIGRLRDEDNYAESVQVGETMHCYGVGQVVASRHPDVRVGEVRLGRFDMQEYALETDASASSVINVGVARPEDYLSVVGITGATAYFGLYDIGRPTRSETIVISAAGSSVGGVVAQLAKREGCRVVGIVSTDEKARRVRDTFGYDAVVSYRDKSVGALSADVSAACPRGVDIYYDNTGGDISEAMLPHYNDYARIVVVGRLALSHLANTRDDHGRRDHNEILTKRIRKEGFVLLDYQREMPAAILQLARWVREGALRSEQDVIEGFERLPEAFFRVVGGENRGKQLVRVGTICDALDPSPRLLGRIATSAPFPTGELAGVIRRFRGRR